MVDISSVRAVIKELVLPEFGELKKQMTVIDTRLEFTNKRLDDINVHLADQSRRIDETNRRIDELTQRIDCLRMEFIQRMDSVRGELTQRIDAMRDEFIRRMDTFGLDLINRIDEVNDRLSRLYEVIVRKDEHEKLESKVNILAQRLEVIEKESSSIENNKKIEWGITLKLSGDFR